MNRQELEKRAKKDVERIVTSLKEDLWLGKFWAAKPELVDHNRIMRKEELERASDVLRRDVLLLIEYMLENNADGH